MNKSDLQFIKTTSEMVHLFHEPSMNKTAQDGMSGIMSTVKEYATSKFDKNNPVESILAFLGPGLFWVFGFKKLAVVFELAEALGFNWTEFFASIKEKLRPYLTNVVEGGQPQDTSFINSIVSSSAKEAFGDQVDPDKIEKIVKEQSLNNMLYIQKFAWEARSPKLQDRILGFFKGVGGRRVRNGVTGFIVKFVSWMLAAILISLGFTVVGSLAKKVFEASKNKITGNEQGSAEQISHKEPSESDKAYNERTKNVVLTPNPSADHSLFTTSYNDNNHVWFLHFGINSIKDKLIEWAQELYPQLNDRSAFEASSKFNQRLKMFQDRNKDSHLEMVAVPQPFKSIKEIVDSFAVDVAAHTDK